MDKNIKVKIIEHAPHSIKVAMCNVPLPFINSLRRIILEELPAVAITYVNFNKYDGLMAEEVLAHRLGLVPIFCDAILLKDYNADNGDRLNKDNCLRMKITKSSEDESLYVKSNDIQLVDFDSGEQVSSLSEYFGSYAVENEACKNNTGDLNDRSHFIKPNVIITKLGPHQHIDLDIYATKNVARDHAKYSNVNVCYYHIIQKLTLTRAFINEDAFELKKKLGHAIEIRKEGGDDVAHINENSEYIELDKIDDNIEGVLVDRSEYDVMFYIESEYLDPWEILKRGIYVLVRKAKTLRDDIQNYLKSGGI